MSTTQRAKPGAARQWLLDLIASPPDTDDCVRWPFSAKPDGYPQVNWYGKNSRPTRIVLTALQGPPPPGPRIEAAHAPGICHNPNCVNPRHLRWATPTDNASDRLADGTHARGEQNPRARLTSAQVLAIYASPAPQLLLAMEYGVTQSHVSRIQNGLSWSWLTGHQRAEVA